MGKQTTITGLEVKDIRFPTSLQHDGSDAMHTNPDYSCAYVIIRTDSYFNGHGLTFTCGNGTEVVVAGINALSTMVVGKQAYDIFNDFGTFWRKLTSDSQLRWIGPEKGVMHLATAAVINALWDLWGRLEDKPVWKLLSDMTPEQLVSTIDFRYITDVVTKDEAIEMLKKDQPLREQREKDLLANGYPAYTTQVGWLGYSDAKIKTLCQKYLDQGFTAFKVKVGQNLENDKQRCKMVRESIGWNNTLMVDANQVWDVQEAIDWMVQLKEFKPLWIEEPTSPDDVIGHAAIARALEPHGIKVATGEMCANRIMFKQFLQHKALHYCQIDSARIGGVNEILSVYLMAKKLNVKVCPHAGGVGLCEMVQHLQFWDFVCLNGDKNGKWIEYVDQQHEHFKVPTNVKNAAYIPPTAPGYNTEMFEQTLIDHEYPTGKMRKNIEP
ncbi:Mandelate racemase / muconate lactonizing enzyme, C-terminal domain [Nesidiocoris tenuis]|uniref:L-fuconate dehydratase n=1 Tax=Nesidiocoris tenuis TaxID=355587 RepID=A0ABN7BCR8_9HEMI|nr:Mandelate racemase / muconate lactonizing enzyme, C-terminal domain [Nesidiocoris tenuis]